MADVKLVNQTGYAMLLGPKSYDPGPEPYPYCSGTSCTAVLYNGDSQTVTIPDDSSYLNLTYTLCLSTNVQPGPWCDGQSPGYASIQFQPKSPQVFIAKADPSKNFTLTVSGNTYTLKFMSDKEARKKKKFT